MSTSRRDFIKLAAAGAAGMAIAEALPATSQAQISKAGKAPGGSIAVRLTSGDKRFAAQPPVHWQPAAAGATDAIVLDPSKSYQDVLGFGAAFTDAACYNFNELPPERREQLLHEFFAPSEMNFSVCRTCIGSSDYSSKLYTYDDGDPDPELKRFSIDHDRQYILPAMRQARKINPDLFLLGSPWSPPAWMKANDSMLGGTFRKRYYGPYAQYFVKYLKAYEAEGVAINAVTSQNEVDTDQDGRMPACLFGQEYEIEFVSKYLGPEFEKNDLATKIWIIDHNYNLWGRAICELDEPEVSKYVDGVAWHGYAGAPESMTRVHDAHPEKHTYWTEGGPDYTDPNYLTDWTKWSSTFSGVLRNWSRCIIGWNLALDEKGTPNIGPFPCGGVVTINSQTKEISRCGQYWALAHYSRAIRRGARRFDSQGNLEGVSHVAFANPDGTNALVLTNAGAEKKIALRMAAVAAELTLPRDSVTTLTWQ